MRRRCFVTFLMLLLGHVAAGPLAAQERELKSHDLYRALQVRIDMREFQNPMTLKETLELFYQNVHAQGVLGKDVGLPIVIAQSSFKEVHPEAPDIYETQVKFPPYPKSMSLANALRTALAQVLTSTTFVVRRDHIEIVPTERAKLEFTMKQNVLAEFQRKPLLEAIEELADISGVSIQVDGRLTEKARQTMTARFYNDVSVRDALLILTDMAGLKIVELPTALYVTSPENAVILQGELAKERSKASSK